MSLAAVLTACVPAPARAAEAPDPTVDDPCAEVLTFAVPGSTPGTVSRALVVVPREYGLKAGATTRPEAAKRYPVVYLLHGYGAGYANWYTRSREAGRPLSTYADRHGLILVCVDGKRASWYLDVPPDSEDAADWQVETMITRHLIPEIDRRYRTWAEPLSRGIVGLSMGGHGAIYLTARHPDLFSVCGDMSGSINLTSVLNKQDLTRRLGPVDKYRDRWMEHSAATQAERLAGRRVGLLLDCGRGDSFFEDHRLLHEKLVRLQVPHDYVHRPGGHDWPYWINALPYHLQFAADRLRPAGVTRPPASLPAFESTVLDQGLPDDPRDLDVADVNGDGRPDVILARCGGVAWYANPGWGRHEITGALASDIVSVAAEDIDRDGRTDVAILCAGKPGDAGADSALRWARNNPAEPWRLAPINREGDMHRVRWADVDGDGRRDLLLAPAFDDRDARLVVLRVPGDPAADRWARDAIPIDLPVRHGIEPVRFFAAPFEQVLTASAGGVHVIHRQPSDGIWVSRHLGAGDPRGGPNRGAGDTAMGRLRGGQRFVAAIEPLHGNQAVVYLELPYSSGPWTRLVIDGGLSEGHAVACADLNGDGDDEIIAGSRGAASPTRWTGLKAYRVAPDSLVRWEGHWIDEGGIAAEAVRVVDVNGDKRRDIVAAGRSTRNLKVYLNSPQR